MVVTGTVEKDTGFSSFAPIVAGASGSTEILSVAVSLYLDMGCNNFTLVVDGINS